MTTFFLALIAVVLALGVWIGICVFDEADRKDDLAALLFAEKFCDDLDRETSRWQR